MKKYIVDDLSNQTISGNLTLDGNLTLVNNNITTATYRALLTQTASVNGTNLSFFNGALIIGETYTITTYQAGDNFGNIANVTGGVINQTGCQFIATGEVPANWSNGSELTSSGNLAVNVLENNLGYDIEWQIFQPGVYFGLNEDTGPLYNSFPRNDVSVNISTVLFGPLIDGPIINYSGPSGLGNKDELIGILTWDWNSASPIADTLYNTPIEIKIKQNLNTTPIIAAGSVISSFPFNYAAIDLFAGSNYVESFYTENSEIVSNISELVTLLNNNSVTNYLGTYADDGKGGITLSIPTNLKDQFAKNNELTLQIYAD